MRSAMRIGRSSLRPPRTKARPWMAGWGGAEAVDELPGAVSIGLGEAAESATRGPGAPWGVRGVRRGSTRQMSEGAWGWRLRIVGSWFSGGAGRAPACSGGGRGGAGRVSLRGGRLRIHSDLGQAARSDGGLLAGQGEPAGATPVATSQARKPYAPPCPAERRRGWPRADRETGAGEDRNRYPLGPGTGEAAHNRSAADWRHRHDRRCVGPAESGWQRRGEFRAPGAAGRIRARAERLADPH